MSPEDETQRIRIRQERPAAMPGSLDLAEPSPAGPERADTTAVLSLDELFDRAAEPQTDLPPQAEAPPLPEPQPEPEPPMAVADAPTWTAVPVPQPAPAAAAPAPERRRASSDLAARVRADAAAAWTGSRRRGGDWLRSGDNAVILLTAAMAVLLLAVVAALAG